MIIKLIYGLFLTSILTFAALTEVDRQEFVRQNILDKYNPGFENGKAKWTNSDGTFALDSSSNIGTGLQSGSFDASATTQTLTSSTVSIPKALYGQSCLARIKYKGGDANLAFKVMDGSSNVLASETLSASTIFRPVGLSFVCPTTGSLKLQISSTANAAIIYLDDAYIGENFQVATTQAISEWKNDLTFTTSGFGTISVSDFRYQQVGDRMFVKGRFTIGTVAAAEGYIELPTGLTINTSKMSSSVQGTKVGGITRITSGASYASLDHILFYDGSTNNRVYYSLAPDGSNALDKDLVNAQFGSGEDVQFDFEVPITEWAGSTNALSFDKAGQSWSGYHDADCGWTFGSASFTDAVSVDASCTFAERTNRNFGTVTSYNDGTPGNNYPGITFTPVKIGSYYVCAKPVAYNGTANQQGDLQLYDGTTEISTAATRQAGSTVMFTTIPVCGIYKATSVAAKNIYLRGSVYTTGTLNINNNTSTAGSRTVEWSIFALDQEIPATILKGVVGTQSTVSERIERLSFGESGGSMASPTACTSASCTVYSQSGSWVSSIARNSTGDYSVTIATGIFASAPTCVASTFVAGTVANCESFGSATATAIPVLCRLSNGVTDSAVNLICMGPKGSL